MVTPGPLTGQVGQPLLTQPHALSISDQIAVNGRHWRCRAAHRRHGGCLGAGRGQRGFFLCELKPGLCPGLSLGRLWRRINPRNNKGRDRQSNDLGNGWQVVGPSRRGTCKHIHFAADAWGRRFARITARRTDAILSLGSRKRRDTVAKPIPGWTTLGELEYYEASLWEDKTCSA